MLAAVGSIDFFPLIDSGTRDPFPRSGVGVEGTIARGTTEPQTSYDAYGDLKALRGRLSYRRLFKNSTTAGFNLSLGLGVAWVRGQFVSQETYEREDVDCGYGFAVLFCDETLTVESTSAFGESTEWSMAGELQFFRHFDTLDVGWVIRIEWAGPAAYYVTGLSLAYPVSDSHSR